MKHMQETSEVPLRRPVSLVAVWRWYVAAKGEGDLEQCWYKGRISGASGEPLKELEKAGRCSCRARSWMPCFKGGLLARDE